MIDPPIEGRTYYQFEKELKEIFAEYGVDLYELGAPGFSLHWLAGETPLEAAVFILGLFGIDVEVDTDDERSEQ